MWKLLICKITWWMSTSNRLPTEIMYLKCDDKELCFFDCCERCEVMERDSESLKCVWWYDMFSVCYTLSTEPTAARIQPLVRSEGLPSFKQERIRGRWTQTAGVTVTWLFFFYVVPGTFIFMLLIFVFYMILCFLDFCQLLKCSIFEICECVLRVYPFIITRK